MVIKGSSRGQSAGDIRRLAAHLLATENEITKVVEINGTAATDLPGAMAEMRAVSLGTRTRKSVYHASINVDRSEADGMTRDRWLEAVNELERRLGLVGHPRAVVQHRKHDRDHLHVVWGRINPLTMKTASDSNNYQKHEQAARALEVRFDHRPVVGAHTRSPDTARPVARATHADWQAAERTGIAVDDVAARIQAAWSESDSGMAFAAALRSRGLSLASGRKGLLVIDEAGTPHSIARRLGLKTGQVRAKLADIDINTVPAVAEVKSRQQDNGEKTIMRERRSKNKCGVTEAPTPRQKPTWSWNDLDAYWRSRGHSPVRRYDSLVIDAGGGAIYQDFGDRIELECDGEPTNEQTIAMIEAGKARGWQGIRFYGGSEEWQQRARVLALRAGFPPGAISLECEDGKHKESHTAQPLPMHLRRKLGLPDDKSADQDNNIPKQENRDEAQNRHTA